MNDIQHELIRQADKLLVGSKSVSEKPVIAAVGLVNAGKSYLLNMLTEHIDEEFFRVADQRETAQLKKLETATSIYLDTPGLDANSVDTQEAMIGIFEADVVLFVHQPQGELEESEMQFLNCLRKSFGQYAEQNIILVLSKADKESSEKIDLISKKIHQQCVDLLRFSPRIFKVSGQRFKTGTQQHKDGLIRHSHIVDLVGHVNEISAVSVAARKIRKVQAIDELIIKISAAEADLQQACTLNQKEINNRFGHFNEIIDSLRDSIISFNNRYQNI
jgi:tRNA U34 5-carboxymethylaminomethyl modifying GTPase MnmE/TrmE